MILNKSIVVFGKGDIMITSAIGMTSGYGKILLDELGESREIGSQISSESLENYPHLVELVFEKTESIDVLIQSLKRCKQDMIKFQKREKGEWV